MRVRGFSVGGFAAVVGVAVAVTIALVAVGASAQTPTAVDFVAPPLFASQGNAPVSIATRDLNGDGNLDLVVVNSNPPGKKVKTTGSVLVLLGDGTGGFTPAPGSPIPVGANPDSVAIGNLDGDGKLDLVVANSPDNKPGTLSVLLGHGDGTFAPVQGPPVTVGNAPSSVAIGDLNGDSKPDLAVANLDSNTVSVLQGDGTGGFSPLGTPIAVGAEPSSVKIGDLNGDSPLDVVVANLDSNTLSVLLGKGDGTFTQAPGSPISVPAAPNGATAQPADVAIGDLNLDDHADLVTADRGNNTACVFLGGGSGAFAQQPCFANASTHPTSVAIADFGLSQPGPDVAVGSGDSGEAAVLDGKGDGGFAQKELVLAAGRAPISLAVGDFNHDNMFDLAFADKFLDGSAIFLNTGNRDFRQAPVYKVGSYPEAAAIGNLNSNSDSMPDIAVANTRANNLTVLFNQGSSFSTMKQNPVSVGDAPKSIAIGDVNHNGKLDLVVANGGSNNVSVLLGDGNGGFPKAPGSPITVGTGPVSVAICDVTLQCDLNGDGNSDLVVANSGSNSVSVLLGNGDGSFTPAPGSPVAVGTAPNSVAIGDVNGDSRPDLVAANSGSNTVSVLLGNGGGSFAAAVNIPAGSVPTSVALGNLNGDSHPDLVVADCGSDQVSVSLGAGNGGFGPPQPFSVGVGSKPAAVAIGDLNGDGVSDIAIANSGGKECLLPGGPTGGPAGSVSVLVGAGGGDFAAARSFALLNDPFSIAIGDLDGDNRNDLVVANGRSRRISVMINATGGTPPPLTGDDPPPDDGSSAGG